ncbi:MAG: hypothetical protein GX434_12555 [Peptococcaceae bacterium]|nr:hypothetical protein [Peptococcaceae bacterium]
MIVGLDNSLTGNAEALSNQEKNDILPTVGSFENLKKILEDAQNKGAYGMRAGLGMNDVMLKSEAAPKFAAADSQSNGMSEISNQDYSQTNIQVQGVDEADTVKTDGEYIYKITNNKLIVAKAYPSDELKVISTLNYDQGMHPVEMYVDQKRLIIILNQNHYYLRDTGSAEPAKGITEKRILPPAGPFESSVKVLIYDLFDKTNLKQIRELELDGQYISSRKIGDQFYLVNNKYLPVHLLKEGKEEQFLPAYKDSAEGGTVKRIGYQDISYFPGSPEPNYLIIAGMNLEGMTDKKTEIKTYLGSGQSIYSSTENLFVAVPEYKYDNAQPLPQPQSSKPAEGSLVKPFILPMPVEQNTGIYKFSLQDGSASFQGKGTVPGTILNQFSMDENNGYFRIATTIQKYSPNAQEMTNNLYILDSGMNVRGKIENMAPGEKIYSVRFLGNRGYLVTFKTVDPLFVLDLKDPNQPRILGELKIPGYSNYLHPYDENHIIGFGKEAIEVEMPGRPGQGSVKNAYYLGMKIALFDVSDVNNPKEKYKVEIGDRGTDSELFRNHKALLFSKEKNIMAFPITLCEIDSSSVNKGDYLAQKDPRLAYGTPVFQGAMVYSLSESGFALKGMITHQPQGKAADLQKSKQYDYNRNVSRILFIKDTIYTVSNGYLKANDMNTLQEKGGISILN